MANIAKSAVVMVVGIIMVAYTLPVALIALDNATLVGGSLYFTTPTANETAIVNLWNVMSIFGVIGGLVLVIAPAISIVSELS